MAELRPLSSGDRFVNFRITRVNDQEVEVLCACGETATLPRARFTVVSVPRYCSPTCRLKKEEKFQREGGQLPPQYEVKLVLPQDVWARWSVRAAQAGKPLSVYLSERLSREEL